MSSRTALRPSMLNSYPCGPGVVSVFWRGGMPPGTRLSWHRQHEHDISNMELIGGLGEGSFGCVVLLQASCCLQWCLILHYFHIASCVASVASPRSSDLRRKQRLRRSHDGATAFALLATPISATAATASRTTRSPTRVTTGRQLPPDQHSWLARMRRRSPHADMLVCARGTPFRREHTWTRPTLVGSKLHNVLATTNA